MRDIAIVGRNNRYGLTRDAEILRQGLESVGVQAAVFDKRKRALMDRLRRRKVAGMVVHLERIHPAWLGAASRHVLIPNQERFPKRHIGRLRRVDRVLAKTQHAREIFAGLGVDSACLGFTSPDRYDPAVPRDWKRFFHLAGGSTLKGTGRYPDAVGRTPRMARARSGAKTGQRARIRAVQRYAPARLSRRRRVEAVAKCVRRPSVSVAFGRLGPQHRGGHVLWSGGSDDRCPTHERARCRRLRCTRANQSVRAAPSRAQFFRRLPCSGGSHHAAGDGIARRCTIARYQIAGAV